MTDTVALAAGAIASFEVPVEPASATLEVPFCSFTAYSFGVPVEPAPPTPETPSCFFSSYSFGVPVDPAPSRVLGRIPAGVEEVALGLRRDDSWCRLSPGGGP